MLLVGPMHAANRVPDAASLSTVSPESVKLSRIYITGFTAQMRSAYSRMLRSLEK
jgi:hypothetical protein